MMEALLLFLKKIPEIFYSRSFYTNLIRRGKGIGMAFILLQVLLGLAVPLVRIATDMPDLHAATDNLFARFPSITVKDQKLSIDRPAPYVVDVGGSKDKPASVVFDTTPREKNLDEISREMNEKDILALVTSDFVVIKKGSTPSLELYSFRNYPSLANKELNITHENWIMFGKTLISWGIPFLIALMFIFFFIGAFIGTVCKALIVKLICLFTTVKPDFAAAMRLSVAATIPVCVVEFLVALLKFKLFYSAGPIIWLGYAIFGLVVANKEAKAEKAAAKS